MKNVLWLGLMVFSVGFSFPVLAQYPISSPGTVTENAATVSIEGLKENIGEKSKELTKKSQEAKGGESEACGKDDLIIKPIPLKSFDEYARKNMWVDLNTPINSNDLTPPIKKYDEALKFVKEKWYATNEEGGVKITDQGNIVKQRQAYLQNAATKTLADATQLRALVKKDTDAVSDATKHPEDGCNLIGDWFVQNTKLMGIIKQQYILTYLQWEALQMTVARDLLKETSEENPDVSDSPLSLLKGL